MAKNKTIEKFANWEEEIDPRVEKLIADDLYIEAMLILFATLEFQVQEAIKNQELWIGNLVKKSDLGLRPEKGLEKKPLGELIKRFEKYSADKDLVTELKAMNSFRRKLVHGIMSVKMNDLNKQAKKKYAQYHELTSKLSRYNLHLIEKRLKKYKRSIKKIA